MLAGAMVESWRNRDKKVDCCLFVMHRDESKVLTESCIRTVMKKFDTEVKNCYIFDIEGWSYSKMEFFQQSTAKAALVSLPKHQFYTRYWRISDENARKVGTTITCITKTKKHGVDDGASKTEKKGADKGALKKSQTSTETKNVNKVASNSSQTSTKKKGVDNAASKVSPTSQLQNVRVNETVANLSKEPSIDSSLDVAIVSDSESAKQCNVSQGESVSHSQIAQNSKFPMFSELEKTGDYPLGCSEDQLKIQPNNEKMDDIICTLAGPREVSLHVDEAAKNVSSGTNVSQGADRETSSTSVVASKSLHSGVSSESLQAKDGASSHPIVPAPPKSGKMKNGLHFRHNQSGKLTVSSILEAMRDCSGLKDIIIYCNGHQFYSKVVFIDNKHAKSALAACLKSTCSVRYWMVSDEAETQMPTVRVRESIQNRSNKKPSLGIGLDESSITHGKTANGNSCTSAVSQEVCSSNESSSGGGTAGSHDPLPISGLKNANCEHTTQSMLTLNHQQSVPSASDRLPAAIKGSTVHVPLNTQVCSKHGSQRNPPCMMQETAITEEPFVCADEIAAYLIYHFYKPSFSTLWASIQPVEIYFVGKNLFLKGSLHEIKMSRSKVLEHPLVKKTHLKFISNLKKSDLQKISTRLSKRFPGTSLLYDSDCYDQPLLSSKSAAELEEAEHFLEVGLNVVCRVEHDI